MISTRWQKQFPFQLKLFFRSVFLFSLYCIAYVISFSFTSAALATSWKNCTKELPSFYKDFLLDISAGEILQSPPFFPVSPQDAAKGFRHNFYSILDTLARVITLVPSADWNQTCFLTDGRDWTAWSGA